MPFKICQTVEDGELKLCIVPDKWEEGSVLSWPLSNHNKLLFDENSKPGEDWVKINCIVKRRNLKSYKSAKRESSKMSDVTETETDDERTTISGARSNKFASNMDFNNLADTCLINDSRNNNVVAVVHEIPTNSQKSNKEVNNVNFDDLTNTCLMNNSRNINLVGVNETPINSQAQDNKVVSNVNFDDLTNTCLMRNVRNMEKEQELDAIYSVTENLINADNPNEESQNLDANYYIVQEPAVENVSQNSEFEILSNKLDHLTAIVESLQNTQENILNKFASVTTLLEEYMKRSSREEVNKETCTNFKPINDVAMLKELENNLKHKDFNDDLMKTLSVVCNKGKGRGLNNAYTLIDVMFTRKFMTECSWAGGTRKENCKTCFKAYTNIIDFFFRIVHATDNGYTKADCEAFLKNVMRHAVARNASKQIRSSAGKRRSKKNIRSSSLQVLEQPGLSSAPESTQVTERPKSPPAQEDA